MDSYVTLKQFSEYRYEDRKSVFWGFAKPIQTESEAIEFIQSIKKTYPDARHWVYAYVLRKNSTMRYTDDREPQGTAGMPVLDVIRKNGVKDAVIVVVRYFGGVLLGTGGLVHAYTEAALGALNSAKVIEYNTYVFFDVRVTYSDYQRIASVLTKYDFLTENTDYSDNVKISGSVKFDVYENIKNELLEITGGRAEILYIDKKYDFRE